MIKSHTIQMHSGSYYGMLFIPVGIILYLAIKYGSDLNVLNRGLTISGTEYENSSFGYDKGKLRQLFGLAQKINDDTFMIAHMPIRLEEFKFGRLWLGDATKIPSNHLDYLGGLMGFYGFGDFHNRLLYVNDEKNKHWAFEARVAYDQFIKSGFFELDKSDNVASFINKNHIVSCRDISSKFSTMLNVINLNDFQCKLFKNKCNVFSKYNSLFPLYMRWSRVKVINC